MAAGSMTQFQAGKATAGGYVSKPSRTTKRGVVVIQEWWGLVPHIKNVTERFSAEGYLALAPDLYHGKSTVHEEEATHLMEGLDWGRAAQEVGAAVRHLHEKEGIARVGIVGFCMGGALTILAVAQGGVDAYAAYYGFPQKSAANLEAITAPGIIFVGENEEFFSVPDARSFVEQQKKRGREAELVVYPRAGHAFFNDTRQEVYRPDAARDAWRRTLELFERHLGQA